MVKNFYTLPATPMKPGYQTSDLKNNDEIDASQCFFPSRQGKLES